MKLLYKVTSTLCVDEDPIDRRPAESQGIFPPGTKKYVCEQAYGRIMTRSYEWDETHSGFNTRTCDIIIQDAEERLKSPSKNYYGYVEVWRGTTLVAIATGEGYCSPTEHLERQKKSFEYVNRSGPDVWFDVIPINSSWDDIQNFLLQKMQFPFSYTKGFLADKHPDLVLRNVDIVFFLKNNMLPRPRRWMY